MSPLKFCRWAFLPHFPFEYNCYSNCDIKEGVLYLPTGLCSFKLKCEYHFGWFKGAASYSAIICCCLLAYINTKPAQLWQYWQPYTKIVTEIFALLSLSRWRITTCCPQNGFAIASINEFATIHYVFKRQRVRGNVLTLNKDRTYFIIGCLVCRNRCMFSSDV